MPRLMTTALLAFLIVTVLAVLAYYIRLRPNSLVIVDRPAGGTVCFSRKGISVDPSPDHYATNGVDHIEPYVTCLLQPAKGSRSLSLFTPDGNRGVGFDAKDGFVQATLTVEWRTESQREVAIRAFFSSLGVVPVRDYLAGNGEVPDASRVLEYPIQGSAAEVTLLAKRILQELCGVSSTDALDIAISPSEKVLTD